MITNETILKMWSCQREITTGEKLLEEMKKISEEVKRNPNAERITDAFGHYRDLQLGIPCGNDSHRLLNVSPSLAVSVITAHIANKKAELIETNEKARIELDVAADSSPNKPNGKTE